MVCCALFYRRHGLGSQHVARQVTKDDFKNFEHIFCFDQKNVRDLREIAPKEKKIVLLGSLDKELEKVGGTVEDPYYAASGDLGPFEAVYQTCLRACTTFLESIECD